ncbi:hypothetical protein C8J56DRAFT_922086 [Mycena floridula]|nr:hypothetical protein C8J56DRAFT_922086 [Mycena floridula]
MFKIASVLLWIFYFVLLLNARSLPLAWHVKVWTPVFRIRIRYRLMRWKLYLFLKSSAERKRATEEWFDSITPIGQNPFESVVTYRSWASIDDSDFNLHLSNSSYAKTLDRARFEAVLASFPQFLRAGGILPLAATHFYFVKEIPILSSYEVRTNTGSWDDKWFYVIGRFVTKFKGKRTRSTALESPSKSDSDTDNFRLRITTPMDAASPPDPSLCSTNINGLASKLVKPESDGATLHTISISQICFKIGRITVPPALVLAANGFSFPTESGEPFSLESPPPHWAKVSRSPKVLRDLFKGGWKNVPVEDRWWEQALGGQIEQQRKERLVALESLRKGMLDVRNEC